MCKMEERFRWLDCILASILAVLCFYTWLSIAIMAT